VAFDPFGDRDTRGYLRNKLATNDPALVRQLEAHAFAANVPAALSHLRSRSGLDYLDIQATHRILFQSVYPWAGQDRAVLAPNTAISRGGMNDLFAHPADVRRAAEYALSLGGDRKTMRSRPGEVFGALAYAHPFLDGNGRSLLTVHTDLAARAGFHIDWSAIAKPEFLEALTKELQRPGSAMDELVGRHIKMGRSRSSAPWASSWRAAEARRRLPLRKARLIDVTMRASSSAPLTVISTGRKT